MHHLTKIDPELAKLLQAEETRQDEDITLIPSENYTHPAVLEALSSVATNKYSEGYPGKRYYNGNKFIDEIENLARERTKEVFKGQFANVQPYSGSPANLAVYFSLLEPGDTVMGIELSHGGHLTHGAKVNFSGKWFNQVPIKIELNGEIDYEKVEADAVANKPKLILAGVTAYPREVNYTELRRIADKVGAKLVADISHTNGFAITGLHKHPFDAGADIITSTTHKLLRGPRGAVIVTNDEKLAKRIDKAIMPGLQGGPHNHQTAAIAVCMKQVLTPEYKAYVQQVADNAQVLAKELLAADFELVTGGTGNHLLLIDLQNKGLTGKEAADLLEEAGIVTNANSIPNDPGSALKPSGIRIGTPAATTRGMGESEMKQIAAWMNGVISKELDPVEVKKEVHALTGKFPVLKLER
jgi:glycine hydroxymethyltransferase